MMPLTKEKWGLDSDEAASSCNKLAEKGSAEYPSATSDNHVGEEYEIAAN
jgi:hypothetical protein